MRPNNEGAGDRRGRISVSNLELTRGHYLMAQQFRVEKLKTAFYPCCANDFSESITLLRHYVNRVIFCDPNHRLNFPAYLQQNKSMSAELWRGDALAAIPVLPEIDVLFYRRDNPEGEGGSGLFVLGDVFLRPFMENFSKDGGLIITDGSNSRGGNFKRMVRKSGLEKFGRHFTASKSQPLLDCHGLWVIDVSPCLTLLKD